MTPPADRCNLKNQRIDQKYTILYDDKQWLTFIFLVLAVYYSFCFIFILAAAASFININLFVRFSI